MVRNRRLSRVVAGLTGIGLAAALAACGGDSGASDGTVRLWALEDGIVNEVQQASIDRFNEGDRDAEVELQTYGNDPYKERLRTALGSGNPPDIFFNWGGGNLKEYVDAGEVRDLSGLFEDNPDFRDSFIPSVLEVATLDGTAYGVPMRGTQPVVLYYNKAVFEDAGVEPPQTWDDLLSLVETFSGEGITPIALAGTQAWTELMWIEYILDRLAGPEVFQAIRDGDASAWGDPAMVEALTMLRELIDAGGFGDAFQSVDYDAGGASAILARGDAAMHLMGTWEYTNQLSESPEFVEGGDLGWVPFPTIEGGSGDPSNVVGNPANMYSISADSGNAEVGEDYLLEQMASEEYVDELIEIGDVPVVVGIEDKLAETANAEHATWVYDLVLNAQSFQLSWDQDLPSDQATRMLEQLTAVFLGDQTPEGVRRGDVRSVAGRHPIG
ncbi:extracellular solute-binding protein [Nocardioides sp. TF02-7]|uniref:ABC transporter substrate-binding protein n=1 Tax=Nocardioides sp. TF02-7 TaxID=2917724 RepID=UPI001F05B532|nr:extracellular solute-binding protein [Nocardioides sp. TF02-7]UMG94652.1 extracellular solute-binding protein [Nocardioides sp. TF02-7]